MRPFASSRTLTKNRRAAAERVAMSYPVLLNGDHAEFEREHADTEPENRPDWPLPSFDAQDWAKAFCKINPSMDEGLMISWFANALMRGFDENASRQPILDVRCERGCTLKKVNAAFKDAE